MRVVVASLVGDIEAAIENVRSSNRKPKEIVLTREEAEELTRELHENGMLAFPNKTVASGCALFGVPIRVEER